jgi:leucyl-tRNA synthetase
VSAASLSADQTPLPASPVVQKLLRKLHQTIRKITQDFAGRWHFNTSVAAIMELVNEITAAEPQLAEMPPALSGQLLSSLLSSLVLLLAPLAPYLSAELWQQMGKTDSILRHPWPVFDEDLAREEEIEVPVQVNGKLRALVRVPPGSDNEVLQKAALQEERVQAAIAGKQIVKVVLIPAKLINIVVR